MVGISCSTLATRIDLARSEVTWLDRIGSLGISYMWCLSGMEGMVMDAKTLMTGHKVIWI
jgi:hypothetical protein